MGLHQTPQGITAISGSTYDVQFAKPGLATIASNLVDCQFSFHDKVLLH